MAIDIPLDLDRLSVAVVERTMRDMDAVTLQHLEMARETYEERQATEPERVERELVEAAKQWRARNSLAEPNEHELHAMHLLMIVDELLAAERLMYRLRQTRQANDSPARIRMLEAREAETKRLLADLAERKQRMKETKAADASKRRAKRTR